jgi:uncharacterized damage-inducible protein DinB
MLAACTPPRTSKASSDGRAAHRLLEAGGIIQDRNWPLVRRMLDRTDERRTAADTMTTTEKVATREYADLLETLATHRYFLRFTVRDLTDEQAAQRTTASSLCLGGLIKHVASTEQKWMSFVLGGAEAMAAGGDGPWAGNFEMLDSDTLAGLLDRYAEVAQRTTEIVASLADLDASHPLPEAPWFEPGASWSARRVLLHLIAETAQHAGHADIIRESLDGARTMG